MKKPRDLPAPATSTSTIGPIIGVVDGSNAAPGEVGEFLSASGTYAYAAGVANTGTIALLNVPPGDWDMYAAATFTTLVGSVLFQLSPVPTGMSTGLAGFVGTFSAGTGMAADAESLVLVGQAGRGSFAVNTQMTFQVQVDQATTTGLLAGTMTLDMFARRRR